MVLIALFCIFQCSPLQAAGQEPMNLSGGGVPHLMGLNIGGGSMLPLLDPLSFGGGTMLPGISSMASPFGAISSGVNDRNSLF